jgi:hypothetical protein
MEDKENNWCSGEKSFRGFSIIHTHVEYTISKHPTADNFIHDSVTTMSTTAEVPEVDVKRFLKRHL